MPVRPAGKLEPQLKAHNPHEKHDGNTKGKKCTPQRLLGASEAGALDVTVPGTDVSSSSIRRTEVLPTSTTAKMAIVDEGRTDWVDMVEEEESSLISQRTQETIGKQGLPNSQILNKVPIVVLSRTPSICPMVSTEEDRNDTDVSFLSQHSAPSIIRRIQVTNGDEERKKAEMALRKKEKEIQIKLDLDDLEVKPADTRARRKMKKEIARRQLRTSQRQCWSMSKRLTKSRTALATSRVATDCSWRYRPS
ncbi:hypothetical protein RF55_5774 [Lasius niger]|uniref:Uncharacterized protein n=1 Tax=Lasius niger TaxID=67767 RepID=A0A0J7KV11_LASNI|nr:hypothetical protein RF55_5774 [Lasius niger]